MACASDFIDNVEVDLRGSKTRVGDFLQYQHQLADELHALDRVHTYGRFFIADVAA